MPQSTDIVVIGIDEETISRFPYRSPVDRAFLADLLQYLDGLGLRAIGLDVLFDQPTETDKDERLRATLSALRTPLAVSHVDTASIVNEQGLQYLNAFVPEGLRGAANLATDPLDGAVRWIFPGELHAGMPKGFARRLAELVGVNSPASPQPIAWRPRPQPDTLPFPVYPAHLVNDLPAEWLKDRIVLVGAILTMTDRHRTPLAIVDAGDDGMMPGILIQAHSLSQLLERRKAAVPGVTTSAIAAALAAATGMLLGLTRRGLLVKLAASLAILSALWIGATFGFSYGLPMMPLVAPTLALLLSLWMIDVLVGRVERQKRKFVQGAFARYVSPEVVRQLVDDPDRLAIASGRQEAAFIFTDIAGFTQLSEQLSSERLTAILNEYLEGACRIIFAHGGAVDKFIGDAIMVMFNAPLPQPDFVQRCLACAIELDRYAESFRLEQNRRGIPFGSTRIGLHCGMATVGNFGSQARLDFTALGDTVNTAARTESVNKYFGTRICCTGDIVARCPDRPFLPIGEVVMKGKQRAVPLYMPIEQEQVGDDLVSRYSAAYRLLADHDPEALAAFEDLNRRYSEHPLVAFHHQRLRTGALSVSIVMEDK
jgi:class 3 adenylate cyclase/CHASE2 domain-containing sensor protein